MKLLLNPQQLTKGLRVLQSLHIDKTAGKAGYETSSLNNREIKTTFKALPENAKKILSLFDEKNTTALRDEIRRRYASRASNRDFETFYREAALRHLHQWFVALRPFMENLKWYHRVQLSDKRYQTAPCRFSSLKPRLRFRVLHRNNGLQLATSVILAGTGPDGALTEQENALTAFRRYGFLLGSEDTWFLLASKDYKVLEWLDKHPPRQYASDIAAFTHHVLAKLEETHPVERDELPAENAIETIPENRLSVSELNNAFLLLTPYWIYDGFIVEGPYRETFETTRDGKKYIIRRNQQAEEAFTELIRGLHPRFKDQRNGFCFLSFAEATKKQWFLKMHHQLQEQDVELTGMDMLQHFRYSPHRAETLVELEEDRGPTLALRLEVRFGAEKVSPGSLQKTLLAGQRAVVLKGNMLGILDDGWLSRYATLVKHSRISGELMLAPRWITLTETGPETSAESSTEISAETGSPSGTEGIVAQAAQAGQQRSAPPSEAATAPENAGAGKAGTASGKAGATSGKAGTAKALNSLVIREAWWEKWQHWQEKPDPLYDVPSALQAGLRPYQQKGYEWLRLLAETGAGACLADDMGLGKTLQTIAFLLSRLEQDPGARHLVVCPASLIYNWQQELAKFAPSVHTVTHHGTGRDEACLKDPAVRVIITSYGTLRSDEALFSVVPFDTAVIDESHHIKNPDALVTRAVSQLQAAARITLSGTPVMNNTFDLYSQLQFLVPGMFGSREFFRKQYANPIDRDRNEEKTMTLQRLTAPFILRRTKQQVAPELPEKTETVLWCRMNSSQRQQYDAIKDDIRTSIFLEIKNKGLQKSKLSIIQGITRLRQVCNSPLLLPEADRISSDSAKIELLMEELGNDLREHKVLVFSQFSSMLNLLSAECRKHGIDHYHFDGSTPARQRMEMVNNFQDENNRVNVFLISLMAGNTGLNLTAAGYVFLFDPWWNTAVQDQAVDRSHRIGQTRNVFAYKMVCRDSIEEKIIRLQEQKKKLAGDLIGNGDGFVKQLRMEDLEFLLE